MKSIVVAISAAAFIAASPVAFAMGTSSKTPGHEMHLKGSKKVHHSASAQAKGSKMAHPGTSGYAPGQTTGSSTGSSSTKGSY